MALDEALLAWVSDAPEAACFRTYGWEVPTLSLGYFQRLEQAASDPRWREVPLVRRPTGGGAIWHEHELTYSLVLPAGHRQARPSTALYHGVHAAIARAIRGQGLEVHPRGRAAGVPGGSREPRPFLCFSDRDPEDLIFGDRKVVGSAQRRRAGAILQHGSILLRGGARTPEHPGLGDLADVPAGPEFWADLIEREIMAALGLTPVPCDAPTRGRLGETAERLERGVYRDDAWTRRRS